MRRTVAQCLPPWASGSVRMTPEERELMERMGNQIAVEKDPNKFTELCPAWMNCWKKERRQTQSGSA